MEKQLQVWALMTHLFKPQDRKVSLFYFYLLLFHTILCMQTDRQNDRPPYRKARAGGRVDSGGKAGSQADRHAGR